MFMCFVSLETVRRFNGVINFNITPLSLLFDCFTSSSVAVLGLGQVGHGLPTPATGLPT